MKPTGLRLSGLVLAALCAVGAGAQGPNERVRLPASTHAIARLAQLRQQAVAMKLTFTPRITGVSDTPLAKLTGDQQPSRQLMAAAPRITAQALRVVAAYNKLPGVVLATHCTANATTCDYRNLGMVTPIKRQSCGDCWAFASAAQVESSLLMAGWSQKDLAEQHILDCSGAGSCGGGTRLTALTWVVGSKGVSDEAGYPYAGGVQHACKPIASGPGKLIATGFVNGEWPSVANIKTALATYGPVSVSIYATPLLQSFGGPNGDPNEVFNEQNNGNGTNHAILIIGWSDAKQAWLIKNSWGTDWGVNGFGWVHYGSNNIGRNAVWSTAPKFKLVLSPSVLQEIGKLQLITKPFLKAAVLPR